MPSKTIVIGLLVGCFMSGCKGSAPLPPKALELNRTGAEALEKGDLETADARFALALEYNPRFVEALVNQGLVEVQRGNFKNARKLLGRARRINPDVAQPHHGLGVLAEREGRPDVAAKHYDEALRIDPGFAPSRANLARLLFESGRYEHARVQFKRLTEVAPDDVHGYVGLAESLLHLDRIEEADAVVENGLERAPKQADLVILRARSYLRTGQWDRAVELLTPLARSHDDIAVVALGWLATAEIGRGRLEYAVGAARKALELDPHASVAVYALATALTKLHDPGASAWVTRAEQLAPGARASIEKGAESPAAR
jgi:tetratricopeptide (TPR) repeat protein